MEIVEHSELLSFLQALIPSDEDNIDDIVVDYNGEYMYTACISYDRYNSSWKCTPQQPTVWDTNPYMDDSRTVRTASPTTLNTSIRWAAPPSAQDTWGMGSHVQGMDRARANPMPVSMRGAELHNMAEIERNRAYEEARHREREVAYQRILDTYVGSVDTPTTRAELTALTDTINNHTHTLPVGGVTRSLSEAAVPANTEEARSSLRDLMTRYMSFGRSD